MWGECQSPQESHSLLTYYTVGRVVRVLWGGMEEGLDVTAQKDVRAAQGHPCPQVE